MEPQQKHTRQALVEAKNASNSLLGSTLVKAYKGENKPPSIANDGFAVPRKAINSTEIGKNKKISSALPRKSGQNGSLGMKGMSNIIPPRVGTTDSSISRPSTSLGTRAAGFQIANSVRSKSAMEIGNNSSKNTDMDIATRLNYMEKAYEKINKELNSAKKKDIDESSLHYSGMQEAINFERERCLQLENAKADLMNRKAEADALLIFSKQKVQDLEKQIADEKAIHQEEIENLKISLCAQLEREISSSYKEKLSEKQKKLETFQKNVIDLQSQQKSMQQDYLNQLNQFEDSLKRDYDEKLFNFKASLEQQLVEQIKDLESAKNEVDIFRNDMKVKQINYEKSIADSKDRIKTLEQRLESEQQINDRLKITISEMSTSQIQMESMSIAKKTQIDLLQKELQQQSEHIVKMKLDVSQALEDRQIMRRKLIEEETLRRKLHNVIQELKGNIRVFCRVRPALDSEKSELVDIAIPNKGIEPKDIFIRLEGQDQGLSTQGIRQLSFSFDRVFSNQANNSDIYDEISQLIQSALDGYNVCIFAYGQTGSGKTFTMSAEDGMIPRAVNQIYEVIQDLKKKGWHYEMTGEFLEIYNENIQDLLLNKQEDVERKKYEIHHDIKSGTTVTNLTCLNLDSIEKVAAILARASRNRTVAATLANERSSRSHSVFTLRLKGENSNTGECCKGLLNLIDLAGSERLSQSHATGDRLKETQAINKSLSCLGDVICALGNAKDGAHVPYRNSKLTYLLQQSLGGNSKILMFVNISPLKEHANESICSLRFATKVNSTHIGMARKQKL